MKARKDTRLKAEFKNVTLKDGTVHTGLVLNHKETGAPLKVKVIEFADPKNIENVINFDNAKKEVNVKLDSKSQGYSHKFFSDVNIASSKIENLVS